jgi:predicted transport protein
MSFQAYIDTIREKTGKGPEDFRALSAKKGLSRFGEVVTWLKSDFGLGHGHANAMAQMIVNPDKFGAPADDKLAALFAGDKAKWRKPVAALSAKLKNLGPDVTIEPNQTYINFKHKTKKFAIIQVSSKDRCDIGLKLTGVTPTERLEAAGSWNAMVTHRIRITDPKQFDTEVLAWLTQAFGKR